MTTTTPERLRHGDLSYAAAAEIEALRARCAELDREIARLRAEIDRRIDERMEYR